MPVGVHLAIVDPGVGGPAAAARAPRRRGTHVRRPGQRPPPAGRRVAPASRPPTSSRILRTRWTRSRGRSTAAICSARPLRTSRPAFRSRSSARPSTRKALVHSDLPTPVVTDGVASRDAALRRQLRQHRSQSRPRRCRRRSASTSGTRVELEISGELYYAVMARTFADARPGRRDPLRGQLQEHVARDLARERSAHAARLARARDPDHDPELASRGGGRRSAHGRASSICAGEATAGARRRPAGRSPGRRSEAPPSLQWSGSDIAGSPVRFATAVNGVNSVLRRSCSRAPSTPSCQPIGTGGQREGWREHDVEVIPERDDPARQDLQRRDRASVVGGGCCIAPPR